MTHTCMHTHAGTHCVNHKISIQNTHVPMHTQHTLTTQSDQTVVAGFSHQLTINTIYTFTSCSNGNETQQMAEKITPLKTSSST